MAKILHLKPANGLAVTDPATMQPLPADGEAAESTNYSQRRLAEGAVEHLPEQRSEPKKGGKYCLSRLTKSPATGGCPVPKPNLTTSWPTAAPRSKHTAR